MNEQVIGEALAIAEELENRVAMRGYKVTAVLYGHNQVVVQYKGGRRGGGQFVKKVGKHDQVS